MEKLRTWVYGHKAVTDVDTKGEITSKDTPETHQTVTENSFDSSQAANSSLDDVEIDPQVAEYFKHFPEPYREKVVWRYSRREGIYKWNFFRNRAMENEMHNALKGVFLEDQRDFDRLQEEKNTFEREEEKAKERQMFNEREISPFEHRMLEFVPLQPWDSMTKKLTQVTCLVSIGILSLWSALIFRKNNPTPRWRVYSSMMGSIGVCGCCQVAAAYRLMDWGPFDRTRDDRELIWKARDDFKELFRVLKTYVEEK